MSDEGYDTDDGMMVTRIVIERHLMPDGMDLVTFDVMDNNDQIPALIEVLGMMALAHDGIIQKYPELLEAQDAEDDVDDDEGE